MATGTPLIETALDSVVTNLKLITTANGYRTTVGSVARILKSHEEEDKNNFPALYVILANKSIASQTNREVENVFNILIYGYVLFDDRTTDDNNSASQKIIKLSSDVQEKMYETFVADQFNASVEELSGGQFDTDEGTFEPYGIFLSQFSVLIAHAHSDTSRRVQP